MAETRNHQTWQTDIITIPRPSINIKSKSQRWSRGQKWKKAIKWPTWVMHSIGCPAFNYYCTAKRKYARHSSVPRSSTDTVHCYTTVLWLYLAVGISSCQHVGRRRPRIPRFCTVHHYRMSSCTANNSTETPIAKENLDLYTAPKSKKKLESKPGFNSNAIACVACVA